MQAMLLLAGALLSAPADPGPAGLRAAEAAWGQAFMAGDADTLEALLLPDYVSVNGKGMARDRMTIEAASKAYAASHPGAKPGPLPPTSTVAVHGGVGLVRHDGPAQASVDVFVYDKGRWRALYSQHTSKAD